MAKKWLFYWTKQCQYPIDHEFVCNARQECRVSFISIRIFKLMRVAKTKKKKTPYKFQMFKQDTRRCSFFFVYFLIPFDVWISFPLEWFYFLRLTSAWQGSGWLRSTHTTIKSQQRTKLDAKNNRQPPNVEARRVRARVYILGVAALCRTQEVYLVLRRNKMNQRQQQQQPKQPTLGSKVKVKNCAAASSKDHIHTRRTVSRRRQQPHTQHPLRQINEKKEEKKTKRNKKWMARWDAHTRKRPTVNTLRNNNNENT